jgi:DNA primase
LLLHHDAAEYDKIEAPKQVQYVNTPTSYRQTKTTAAEYYITVSAAMMPAIVSIEIN